MVYSFDVIITTRENRKKNHSLIFTIRTILYQSIQPLNIIVVENKDFKYTKELISREFGNMVSVVDGSLKDRNISYCRNLGTETTFGDVILFMDDDVLLHKHDVFKRIIENMEHLDFMCGADRFWSPIDWAEMIQPEYNIYHILNILKSKSFLPQSIDRISGKLSFHNFTFIGNLGAIKRKVFNTIGKFDEAYEGWGYQDTDLMMRLSYNGYKYELMSDYNIAVYHLAHGADKYNDFSTNKKMYYNKQKELGQKFILSHFFGVFPSNNYNLFKKWED